MVTPIISALTHRTTRIPMKRPTPAILATWAVMHRHCSHRRVIPQEATQDFKRVRVLPRDGTTRDADGRTTA